MAARPFARPSLLRAVPGRPQGDFAPVGTGGWGGGFGLGAGSPPPSAKAHGGGWGAHCGENDA